MDSMPPIQEVVIDDANRDDESSKDLLEPSQAYQASPQKSVTTVEATDPRNFRPFLQKDDYSPLSNSAKSKDPPYSPANASRHSNASEAASKHTDDSFLDPYSDLFTESAAKKDFHERMRHFLRGNVISSENRDAVEIAYLCEAGRIVHRDNTMKDGQRGDAIIEEYKKLLRQTDTARFYNDDIRETMLVNMKGGHRNTGFNAKTVWTKWQTYAGQLRRIFAHLPTTYHKLKSGIQLHDIHDKMIREHYRQKNVSLP